MPGEELGRWSQQSMEDTLTRQRDVLGYDHPDTVRLAHNLAAVVSALGEHQQGRQLDEDTLARYCRASGDDHPDTLRSAHNSLLTCVHSVCMSRPASLARTS